MHTTLRQLRLFAALAEHGSITAAAKACHVTQPTVSMQLKDLTEAVGLPLYERVDNRIHLTHAGEDLLRTARAMSDEWTAFVQRIDAMKGLTRGRLRVALVSTAKYFVPRILGRFCARHRDIDITLEVLNRDGVITRLRENRDDLYIMSIPPSDIALERQPFLPNPLVIIAAASHPLSRMKRLPLARLARERFILREPGSGTRLACDAHFERTGFVPDVRLEIGSNEAIKEAVAAGMGIAIVSRHALGVKSAGPGLAILDVAGFPLHSNWWVLYPRGKSLSPIATKFLDELARSREVSGG
ncbi:MAG TPA: LysR family transcriptional regulator [Casimicrobiaceae bacterium]|nr:LysR family transcriptional regulator [Casimicrobiaceae bacterium]